MGASAPDQKFGTSYVGFKAPDMDRMMEAAGQFQNSSNQFAGQAGQAAGQIQIPQFSNNLDRFSQGLLAKAQQDIASKVQTQQNAIAQAFRKNPGAASVLQQQAGNQAVLANNGLPFQAALAQRSREGQDAALNNQAVAQRLQVQSLVPQQQQTLLNVLSQLGIMRGQQITDDSKRYAQQANGW